MFPPSPLPLFSPSPFLFPTPLYFHQTCPMLIVSTLLIFSPPCFPLTSSIPYIIQISQASSFPFNPRVPWFFLTPWVSNFLPSILPYYLPSTPPVLPLPHVFSTPVFPIFIASPLPHVSIVPPIPPLFLFYILFINHLISPCPLFCPLPSFHS